MRIDEKGGHENQSGFRREGPENSKGNGIGSSFKAIR